MVAPTDLGLVSYLRTAQCDSPQLRVSWKVLQWSRTLSSTCNADGQFECRPRELDCLLFKSWSHEAEEL